MLAFDIAGARAPIEAAAPTIAFDLHVRETTNARIEAIALRVQIEIEPRKRHYSPEEEARLVELFGPPHRWGETLHGVLWSHVSLTVPGFTGVTRLDLPVTCSYDFEVASSKYFDALQDGEIPLLFMFSGTVFLASERGLSVTRIPWELEARYRLPVVVWRDAMQIHFPNTAWIRVHKSIFDELFRFRTVHGLPTWDHTMEALLERARETT